MPESDDITRLKQYVEGDESAFAALVERYVHLVYSTALRQVGNPSQAAEITQAVFIILAQKAKSLGSRTILSGWLYQTARLAAANFLRSEIRRQKREQEAYMESLLNEPTPNLWQQIAPLLDDAMGHLSENDRNVVVLRFFQNRSAAEIGVALGIDSATAQKRITRAVGRLRKFFAKRSVTHSVELITGTISTNSVQVAPVALAKSVTALAIAKGAATGGSTLTLVKGVLKIMAWTKAKMAVITGACVLVAAGTTTITVLKANQPVHIQGIPKDWSILSGNTDQWSWANNTIYGHTTNGDSILASTRQYGDVTVSAMVSTTNREASLVLRMQDADNGYLAAFVPDGTPAARGDTSKISLLRRISGEERELAIFKRRGLSAPGQVEKFTFSAKGRRLEVRLNDVIILRTNDTTFTSGFIGLRVYGWGDIPCDGTFSNLTVR